VPNVKKIRGLNLSGTPWATSAFCGRSLPLHISQGTELLNLTSKVCVLKFFVTRSKKFSNFESKLPIHYIVVVVDVVVDVVVVVVVVGYKIFSYCHSSVSLN